MTIAYLGLGSNLGDRVGYVQQALIWLADCPGIRVLQSSSLYETEPVGYADQEWFINAVVQIDTTLSPMALLLACQAIEDRLGRVRDAANRNGPRTIDVDILFYDDVVMDTPTLTLPHPRLPQRAYALVPMLEVNADLRHPVLGHTMEALHQALEAPEDVVLYGTRR